MPGRTSTRTRAGAAILADATRGLAVASVLVSVVWRSPVDAALFALVTGALLVPRALRVPAGLDIAYGIAVLAAAWSGSLGIYEAISWWDLMMHLVTTGLIAAVAYVAVARLLGLGEVADRTAVPAGRAAGVVVLTTALGLALSVSWEFAEWAGHTYADPAIHVGYLDTLGDLAAAGLGSLLAGVGLTLWEARPAAPDGSPTGATVASPPS